MELRRRMLKIFNPELSATLVYVYGGFKRVIDCRAYGEPAAYVKWGDKVIGNLSAELAGDLARKYPKARYTCLLYTSGV